MAVGLTVGCTSEPELQPTTGRSDSLTLMSAEPTQVWTRDAEKDFSSFVRTIGRARQADRCRFLVDCLNDATVNPLKAVSDVPLQPLENADCADMALQLRAYYSVKKGLPFEYVSSIQFTTNEGNDERYAAGISPRAGSVMRSTQFSTMDALLNDIADSVHSGFYRMDGTVETGDTYVVDVTPESVVPGTVFYDPNGHVLIVYDVDPDGTVKFLQGSPPNFLSTTILTTNNKLGGRSQGGGFRGWRPLTYTKNASGEGGTYARTPNASLPHASATAQYTQTGDYYDWVRTRLATVVVPPTERFRGLAANICTAAKNRVAVVAGGAPFVNAPVTPIPANIYGASGDWENWASPGTDSKLRGAFRELASFVRKTSAVPEASLPSIMWAQGHAALGVAYRQIWAEMAGQCRVTYQNSAGSGVTLTLSAIEARLFDLSFDLNHCPEMRWGAYHSLARREPDMVTCALDAVHVQRFDEEARARYAIDRENPGPSLPPTGVTVSEALARF